MSWKNSVNTFLVLVQIKHLNNFKGDINIMQYQMNEFLFSMILTELEDAVGKDAEIISLENLILR